MADIDVKEIMFQTYEELNQRFDKEIIELIDNKFYGKEIPNGQLGSEIIMMVGHLLGLKQTQQMELNIKVLQKIVDDLQNEDTL